MFRANRGWGGVQRLWRKLDKGFAIWWKLPAAGGRKKYGILMHFAGFQWFLSIPEDVFWSHLIIIGCPFAFANNWTVFGGNCSFSGQSHHIHSWSCESFKRDFQCVLKLARSLSGRLLLRLLLFCLMVPPSRQQKSEVTFSMNLRAALRCIHANVQRSFVFSICVIFLQNTLLPGSLLHFLVGKRLRASRKHCTSSK